MAQGAARRADKAPSIPQASTLNAEDVSVSNAKPQTPNPKPKKLSYKEQREFEALEKEIPALEEEKARITAEMSSGTLPYAQLQELTARITKITRQLEEKEFRWLELSEHM